MHILMCYIVVTLAYEPSCCANGDPCGRISELDYQLHFSSIQGRSYTKNMHTENRAPFLAIATFN